MAIAFPFLKAVLFRSGPTAPGFASGGVRVDALLPPLQVRFLQGGSLTSRPGQHVVDRALNEKTGHTGPVMSKIPVILYTSQRHVKTLSIKTGLVRLAVADRHPRLFQGQHPSCPEPHPVAQTEAETVAGLSLAS